MQQHDLHHKRAAQAALFSLLNLTALPVISFIVLLGLYMKTEADSLDRYYAVLGIKTNLLAAAALLLVSALMVMFGGLHSPWTWVYVVSYFVFVHALFILFATWTLTRAWAGEKPGQSRS